DAARAAAEVDVVQVELEDLVLVVGALDRAGDARLEQLAGERLVLPRDALGDEVAGELHGDGARALADVAGAQVGEQGAEDAVRVDAVVLAEALVLDGDEGIGDVGGEALELDDAAVHQSERAHLTAVAVEHQRRAVGLVGGEAADVGAAADAAASPGDAAGDQQRGEDQRAD